VSIGTNINSFSADNQDAYLVKFNPPLDLDLWGDAFNLLPTAPRHNQTKYLKQLKASENYISY
jgi:hypothetical protein